MKSSSLTSADLRLLAQASALEPALSERLFAADAVPDATIDPFRVTLENLSAAQALNGTGNLPPPRSSASSEGAIG